MHFQPTATELAELPSMSPRERIEYFLTRAIESEEVWGLADSEGWIMRSDLDKSILPIWSYQTLAQACIDEDGLSPQSTSLEHFIDILSRTQESIDLEILAMPDQPGAMINANELLAMFESLIDSCTYFLEG